MRSNRSGRVSWGMSNGRDSKQLLPCLLQEVGIRPEESHLLCRHFWRSFVSSNTDRFVLDLNNCRSGGQTLMHNPTKSLPPRKKGYVRGRNESQSVVHRIRERDQLLRSIDGLVSVVVVRIQERHTNRLVACWHKSCSRN